MSAEEQELKLSWLVDWIGSKKMLRIERWRDGAKHWRAGIEWYGEDSYEFICEYPTLLECLEKIQAFILESK